LRAALCAIALGLRNINSPMPRHRWHIPFLAIAVLSLLGALWTGLQRLGWELPQLRAPLPAAHGPLMVSAFLGTLIGLERAAALGKKWTYGAPLFAAAGALAALLLPTSRMAPSFSAAGSLFLIAIFIFLYRLRPANFFVVIGGGAVLWLIGNLLWAAALPVHRVVPWWIGFLVLTIAGERLELSRLLRLSRWDSAKFFIGILILICGLTVSLQDFETGIKLCGAGLLAIGLWLLRYDMARRSVREKGLARFMALALLSGYVWLAIAGCMWIAFAQDFSAGPLYDAMLHAIFLGFVFSMIFAHAPIIFPSVTGFAMPFDAGFYAHLLLLHLSLTLRIAGDITETLPWQQWGGVLNAAAVLLFLANNIRAIRRGSVVSAAVAHS
jgi:hypothetical protein